MKITYQGVQFLYQGEINFQGATSRTYIEWNKSPFYADFKRISETNWEAGNCMRNNKLGSRKLYAKWKTNTFIQELIHSFKKTFKNKNRETINSKMKTNTKKEKQNTAILIQRLVFAILIQRLGETSGKLQILSKVHEDIASKLYLSWLERI